MLISEVGNRWKIRIVYNKCIMIRDRTINYNREKKVNEIKLQSGSSVARSII